MFENKKSAKAAVSALRRELKSVSKAPCELSHNDCLSLMAKALGFKSWNELEAQLPEAPVVLPEKAAPQPKPELELRSKYRLSNPDGQYDFVERKEDGTAVGPRFELLQGTFERLTGSAGVSVIHRTAKGKLKYDYEGGTEVFWDDQASARENGEVVWLDESGDTLLESMLVLLPEDYVDEPYDDEELPVRPALVAAYKAFFDAEGITFKNPTDHETSLTELNAACWVLGFSLTRREELELLAQVAKGNTPAATQQRDQEQPSQASRAERATLGLQEQAYLRVFDRVFADARDHGTFSFTQAVMQALQDAPASTRESVNGEAYLRRKLGDDLITLNGPLDALPVSVLFHRLKESARTEYEKLVLKQNSAKK